MEKGGKLKRDKSDEECYRYMQLGGEEEAELMKSDIGICSVDGEKSHN